jgi:hypothetical protein
VARTKVEPCPVVTPTATIWPRGDDGDLPPAARVRWSRGPTPGVGLLGCTLCDEVITWAGEQGCFTAAGRQRRPDDAGRNAAELGGVRNGLHELRYRESRGGAVL